MGLRRSSPDSSRPSTRLGAIQPTPTLISFAGWASRLELIIVHVKVRRVVLARRKIHAYDDSTEH